MRASPYSASGNYPRFDSSLDDYDRPVLGVSGAEYHSMDDLLRDYPDVGSPERLAVLCEAWLRLNHGSGYRLINDPDEFKNRYLTVKQRGYSGARARQAAPGCGPYDVSEIIEPQLHYDALRCYVEDRHNGVPYRVEMPWPLRSDALVRFQLLALEDDEDYV
jgi:hypothetical protein